MRLRRKPVLLATVGVAAVALAGATVPALAGEAGVAGDVEINEDVAEGVEFSSFHASTSHGEATVHLLTVDMSLDGVEARTVYPDVVAGAGVMTSLADRVEAVAGVNGDFFNIGETNAPVGPAIADGKDLTAGVPGAQRHGPGLPPGTSNDNVFGVTVDGEALVSSLTVDGEVTVGDDSFGLDGLNQYAITVDGVGVFNSDWGEASRVRATCGTDDDRDGPCSDETLEVEVVDGEVTRVSDSPGDGAIDSDADVLVARDAGVANLEGLAEGDEVDVQYQLASEGGEELETAVGGMPVMMEGELLDLNDDAGTLAPRTSAAVAEDGTTLYLAAIDGRSGSSVGATLASLGEIMADLGAYEAVNFDGGGSTTLVAVQDGNTATSVRNNPSDGNQRAVPNGLGIFSG